MSCYGQITRATRPFCFSSLPFLSPYLLLTQTAYLKLVNGTFGAVTYVRHCANHGNFVSCIIFVHHFELYS